MCLLFILISYVAFYIFWNMLCFHFQILLVELIIEHLEVSRMEMLS